MGALGNAGTFVLSGGTTTWNNDINNLAGGSFQITNANATFTGAVTNDGTVKTTSAAVTWEGTFTNNGAYLSDPSTQTFSDLVVGSAGYLVGYSQDLFIVTNDFVNQSTQNALWNTVAATLQFATSSDIVDPTLHNLYIPGADLGATFTGYTDNFAWGILNIAGQTVTLYDGSGTDGGALYVDVISGLVLSGGTVTNIAGATETLNIYYNPLLPENAYLGTMTYAFASGNGQLIPTPIPGSVLLLGTGLLGLGLLGWRRRKPR